MSFAPNYFVDPEPWLSISFGSGPPIRAALTKIDGVSTEYKWKKPKKKESSGSANTYEGMEYKHPKLTFTGVDADDFDDLRALFEMMQPVPGLGTGTSTTAAAGKTVVVGGVSFAGAAAAKSAAAEATQAGANVLQDGGTQAEAKAATASALKDAGEASTTAASASKEPDPGPRPPTIAVHYPALAWHNITACALVEWDGPNVTETNGVEVVITIIPDKPPVPAGTGTMAAPAPGSQFVGGAAGNAGGGGGSASTPQEKVDKGASEGAAGT